MLLAWLQQVADDDADRERIPVLRAVRRNVQDAGAEALDVLGRFLALQSEKRLAGANRRAVALEPADEHPLLHVPAEARDRDRDCHDYSAQSSRIACAMASTLGTTAFSSGGLYGVGVWTPLTRRIGASSSSKPTL